MLYRVVIGFIQCLQFVSYLFHFQSQELSFFFFLLTSVKPIYGGAKPIYVATMLIPGVLSGVIQWHVLLAYYHCNCVYFFVAIG
jgi:hypothetical protein